MHANLEIALVPHKTAKGLILSYFKEDWPSLSDKQILKRRTDFTVILNNPIKDAPVSDLIKVVRRQGYWGYCQHFKGTRKYKEIHYWLGKKASKIDVIRLFAHELVHARGSDSEKSACNVAEVCEFAYEILISEIYNEDKKPRK